MNVKKIRDSRYMMALCAVISFMVVFCGISHAHATEPVKTYDKTNYHAIESLLIPPVLNWVKKGEFFLQTGRLEFEWEMDDGYLEASLKNQGKYDLDHDGFLVEKATRERPGYVYGYPFPKIDPDDPKAAGKIMENSAAVRSRVGSMVTTERVTFVGVGGPERSIVYTAKHLYYQNREAGPIPNANNLLTQKLIFIEEPFSLRGTNQIIWSYNNGRQDSYWAYDT